MKKKILLFSAAAAVLAFALQSYNAGPAHVVGYNRTGADGGSANCSSGGCHSGGNYQSNMPEIIIRDSNQLDVTSWNPGQGLFVTFSLMTPAPYFGFQMSASEQGTSDPAGTFIAINPATQDTIISGYSIVEHKSAIYNQNMQQISMNMKWTAPVDTTIDTIVFYCTVNLVNNDNSTSGDNWTHFTRKLGRFDTSSTVSVKPLSAEVKLTAYPNPVTDKLNISIDDIGKGICIIRVFDITGKMMWTENASVNKAYTTSVNTSSWASGTYHIQIRKDGAQKTIAIVKQ